MHACAPVALPEGFLPARSAHIALVGLAEARLCCCSLRPAAQPEGVQQDSRRWQSVRDQQHLLMRCNPNVAGSCWGWIGGLARSNLLCGHCASLLTAVAHRVSDFIQSPLPERRVVPRSVVPAACIFKHILCVIQLDKQGGKALTGIATPKPHLRKGRYPSFFTGPYSLDGFPRATWNSSAVSLQLQLIRDSRARMR